MPKLHLCVPNCCEDPLQHGKGSIYLYLLLSGALSINNWQWAAFHRWVFHFAHLRQLPVLVPYMPTDNPRLRDTAYEVCQDKIVCLNIFNLFSNVPTWDSRPLVAFWLQVALVALATNSSFHKELLSTVKSWPHVIYSALPVISAIEPQLNTSSMTDALKEVCQENMHTHSHNLEPHDSISYSIFLIITYYYLCILFLCQALAELYVIDGQYEKVFSIYADVSITDTHERFLPSSQQPYFMYQIKYSFEKKKIYLFINLFL